MTNSRLTSKSMSISMRLMSILLVTVMMFMSTVTVAFALTPEEETKAKEFMADSCSVDSSGRFKCDNSTISAMLKDTTDSVYTEVLTVAQSGGGTVTVVKYYKPADLDIAFRQYRKAMQSSQATDKLNDMTDGLTIEADTAGAAKMLSGFKPILELVIGVIVTLIMFGMTLFTSFDCCYLAFPVFRNKCEDAKQSGNPAMVQKTSNGDTKLRWVSDDAQYAISQSSIDSGKSPWGIYFKKRWFTYVVLAIILFVFMTGNITLFTDIALRLIGGLMDVVANLA